MPRHDDTDQFRVDSECLPEELDAVDPGHRQVRQEQVKPPASQRVQGSVRLKSEVFPIQLRDVALATSIRLTDQEPEEYGFRLRSTSKSETTRFSYTNHYFPTDAARKAAFEKWAAWERTAKEKSGKK